MNEELRKRTVSEAGTESPKQSTDEVAKYITPVSDYHDRLSDVMLDYTFLTSMATRGLNMLGVITEFSPGPNGIFIELKEGWVKIKGALPIEEYKKLVGEKLYHKISGMIEDNKYKIYDNTKDKDPVTGLYPEYDFSMRNGFWLKINTIKYKDDNRPEIDIEAKKEW